MGTSNLEFLQLEAITQEEIEQLKADVESEILKGDFKRASHILKQVEEKKLNRQQAKVINELRSRLRRLSFLHHNPLDLRVVPVEEVFAFGEEVVLSFEIFNLSENDVLIPSKDAIDWLPWGEKRNSCIVSEIELVDISVRDGSRSSAHWSDLIEFEDSWRIPAGASHKREIRLSPEFSGNELYRRITIKAELIPGGLQTGPFDWGMIRLAFPTRIIHVFREKDIVLSEDPELNFKQGLESIDGRRVLLSAVLMDEEKRWTVVDGIVGVMPSMTPPLRRAVTAVLTWITGEEFGNDTHRWMDWWDVNREQRLQEAEAESLQGSKVIRPGVSLPVGTICAGLVAFALGSSNFFPDSPDREMRQIREALNAPYYMRRDGAKKKLAAQGDEAIPILKHLISDESPRVRSAVGEVMAELRDGTIRETLMKALESESSRSVKQKIVESMAMDEGDRLPFEMLPHDIKEDGFLKKRYMDLAVMVTLEDIMHFGRIPGFYDGQFNELWDISDDVFHHVALIASDDDYAYQARVLAIMALHEKKEMGILPVLKPLIMDPKVELSWEYDEFLFFRISEEMILQHRRRNLSKYARFSLSKAGITDFNLAKIDAMKEWLQNNGSELFLESRKKLGLGVNMNLGRSFGKNIVLDIAYNYQQFDQFDKAEEWYKLLIENFPGDEDSALLAEAHYNLACLYSVQKQIERALKHLELSVDKGFVDFSWMDKDRDLDNIRTEPAYSALREMMIDQPAEEKKTIDKE